jgi:transcriptional regulator with GAF, ATPase, and Fis domain
MGSVLALSRPEARPQERSPANPTLAEAERNLILQVLQDTDWVLGGPKGAAIRLGVKRTTLLYKMRRLGIERPPENLPQMKTPPRSSSAKA